jgi:hypothetical protein
MIRRILVSELLGDQLAAGAANGARVLGKAIQQLIPTGRPEIAVLDFDQVNFASASFLREAVLGLRDYCRISRPTIYIAIANPNPLIREELLEVLNSRRDALVACELDGLSKVTNSEIIGVLDDIQQSTLERVMRLGEADATSLATQNKERNAIGPTGWNNRLSLLHEKGLVVESRRGRSKVYRALLRELERGN